MAIENTYLLGKNITLGCGFDLQAKAPLDSRQVVPAYAGLQALIDGNAAYEGMIVYDEETKKTYQAQLVDGVLAFREFGINEAELKDLIASETTAAMEFKGAATALPANPAKGDMYKVTAAFKVGEEDVKVGDSIVYDGTQWFIIPSGDDIEDTWRPVTDVNNDAALTFAAGEKLDVAVAANGTVTYSHEEVEAPKLLAENEQTRTYITEVETDGYGHITGYKTATENVVDTNTEYTFTGQVESSSVYFQVDDNKDGSDPQTVYVDAYSKNEVNTELAKKVDNSVYEAYINGKAMSDEELKQYAKDYADGLAGNYAEAEHTHVVAEITDFDTAVKAYDYATKAEAQGYANAKDNAIAEAKKAGTDANDALEAYKLVANKAIEDEAKARDDADKAFETRVADLEAKFGEGEGEGTVEAQIAAAVAVEKEAREKAVEAVQGEVDAVEGRMDTAEGKITALENNSATKADVAAEFAKYTTTVDQQAIDAAQNAEIAKKVNVADYEADKATFAVAETVNAELAKKANASEVVANTAFESFKTANTQAINAARTGAVSDVEAKGYAVASEVKATYATKEELGEVDAKFAGYNTTAVQKGIDDAQDARIKAIEDDYLVEADIANFETKENVKKVSDALDNYKTEADGKFALKTEAYDDTAVRNLITAEETRATGVEAGLAARIKAVEDDYLVEADKTALTNAINAKVAQTDYDVKVAELAGEIAKKQNIIPANTYDAYGSAVAALEAAEKYVDDRFVEADLGQYTTEQEVKDIVDAVIVGAVDGDTITGLSNLVQYINTHGTEATEMGAAIDVLEGKVETIEGKPAYGITATQVANWDNEVGAKALASTKTTTAEVKDQIEAYGYATTGQVATAKQEAINAAATDAANKYETIGTAQGIVNGLKLGETYEPIGAEGRAKAYTDGVKADLQAEIDSDVKVVNDALEAYKTSNDAALAAAKEEASNQDTVVLAEAQKYADGLNTAMDGRVADLEEVKHEHSNKTVLDSITSGKVGTWDSAVQTVAAGTGLKATKSGTEVAVDFDDEVIFIFDCGTSAGE